MIDYRKKIKVIGFDLDQTLYPKSPEIDTAIQKYLYQKISEQTGMSMKKSEEEFKKLYADGNGLSGRGILIHFNVPNASEILQQALEKARIDEYLRPNKHTVELLFRLKERYHSIDVITGSNIENTHLKLSKLGIGRDLFENIITEETSDKRSGNAYIYWMNLYKEFDPDDFLYIGDRVLTDYEVPKRIGIRSILVNIPTEKIMDNIECHQLRSIEDLSSLLL